MGQPRTQSILPRRRRSMVGENGPDLGRSHDTLNIGVFSMIIYIEEFNLHNSYAFSRFVDHLIDILKIYSLSKEHTQMGILNSTHLHNADMADGILKPQQIQCLTRFTFNTSHI